LPGIALFLGYLGKLSGDERYTKAAQQVLGTILPQVSRQEQNEQTKLTTTGAFTGWGGLIYTLTHLGVLWRDAKLLETAVGWVDELDRLTGQDKYYDLIKGSAGGLVSVLNLAKVVGSSKLTRIAERAGAKLLAHTHRLENYPGVGWLTSAQRNVPLVGFSHGATGIGWALHKLADATGAGGKRFEETALAALAYERSRFNPELSNWPTLSEDANGKVNPQFLTAWCHGAPGVGMSKIELLQRRNDPRLEEELRIAIETTLVYGFGMNHSLCHGDLGNLDFLLEANKVLNDSALENRIETMAAKVLLASRESGWKSGVPFDIESLGFMTGLAGIGYGLLRLAHPTTLPSVLRLDVPMENLF
jgi:type 2 lantibiotic biosynthesis protein LanM